MDDSQMTRALFIASIPPALEDQLIDWLLERDEPMGFTTLAIHGHSSDSTNLSAAEKVSGKQRRLQFQIEVPTDSLSPFLRELAREFTGADLHYWVLPLLACGSLKPAAAGDALVSRASS